LRGKHPAIVVTDLAPLVSFDRNHPERVICPIPFYLLRRISTGIFYDLVNKSDFDNAFGESFQMYVGEVIEFACKPPRFAITPEESYYIGSRKFHGVDWILSDDTGHLFIEAKTKRLTLGANVLRTSLATELVSGELVAAESVCMADLSQDVAVSSSRRKVRSSNLCHP
jgi:hypothetical protein